MCATASTGSACAHSGRRQRSPSRATSRSSGRSSARMSNKAAVRLETPHRYTTCSPRSRWAGISRARCPYEPLPPRTRTGARHGYETVTKACRVSATETVTLTIDGVAVEVQKGTGLVEAALAAGIEIPVFCYEPRLGAPVGACRMCLVEVEGIPKLQAGCTMTAQDGMVVRTALTSAKAAAAQNATLEFLLVNH